MINCLEYSWRFIEMGVFKIINLQIHSKFVYFFAVLIIISLLGCSTDQIRTDLYGYVHNQADNQTKLIKNIITKYNQHIKMEESIKLQLAELKTRWADFSFLRLPYSGSMWKYTTEDLGDRKIHLICSGGGCVAVDAMYPFDDTSGKYFYYDSEMSTFCAPMATGSQLCYHTARIQGQISFADEVKAALKEKERMENELMQIEEEKTLIVNLENKLNNIKVVISEIDKSNKSWRVYKTQDGQLAIQGYGLGWIDKESRIGTWYYIESDKSFKPADSYALELSKIISN
jgi:hypothetical protein